MQGMNSAVHCLLGGWSQRQPQIPVMWYLKDGKRTLHFKAVLSYVLINITHIMRSSNVCVLFASFFHISSFLCDRPISTYISPFFLKHSLSRNYILCLFLVLLQPFYFPRFVLLCYFCESNGIFITMRQTIIIGELGEPKQETPRTQGNVIDMKSGS